MKPDWGLGLRAVILILLAGAAVWLFLITANHSAPPSQDAPVTIAKDWKTDLPKINTETDTVLAHLGITKIKRREIPVPGVNISRSELHIELPTGVVPIELNRALNVMAQKHGARAVASENLKEHTVSIHIVLNEVIVETVIATPKR
ncbi:MAG TPA: hypothetical protein VKS81_01525 [Bacteroidota bacterium]|nr:hypothetical protein [Bacteroidota bacterium]